MHRIGWILWRLNWLAGCFRSTPFAILLCLAAIAQASPSVPNDCVIVAVEKERCLIAAARLQKVNVWARVLRVHFVGQPLGHAFCVFQPNERIYAYNGDGTHGTRELRITSRDPLAIARAYYAGDFFHQVETAVFMQ